MRGRPREKESDIGKIIRTTRKLQGLSQTQLAEKIGVTYQMVQKYEKGTSQLTIARLKQIAQALDITPQVFIEDSTRSSDSSYGGLENKEIKLVRLFRRLSSDKLKDGFINMLEDITKLQKN